MGTYVMSDIHGCFDKFQRMLAKIGFSESDQLILAGDYIDRGPKSAEMLEWLKNRPSNVFPIKGNHDVEFAADVRLLTEVEKMENLKLDYDDSSDLFLLNRMVKDWIKREYHGVYDFYGTIAHMAENSAASLNDLISWSEMIMEFPYYHLQLINGRNYVFVHAGYLEDANDLPEDFDSLESFYIYAREEALMGGIRGGTVIFGHTPTVFKDTPFYNGGELYHHYDQERDCHFYNIDGGCVYREFEKGGRLICLRLEDKEVFYV